MTILLLLLLLLLRSCLLLSQSMCFCVCVVRTGWAYPWAVRIRLCDLMLRGMFDTLDEASYVESKDALLQLLQNRVWPLLGISKHIHSTIYAWIHFRQFAVTGMYSLHPCSSVLLPPAWRLFSTTTP